MPEAQRESAKGVIAMIIACLVWGFSALYYKVLDHIPPLEILAHRTLWSFVIFLGILLVRGRFFAFAKLFATLRSVLILGLAALMISINWFAFIYSIQIEHAVEAALGYYIFPLVAVLLGRVFFGERLSRAQKAAVVMAGVAVSLLTFGLGVAPWISLLVALTFGFYGVVKKRLAAGPVVSVTAEVAVLTPAALAVLAVFHARGEGHFGGEALESGMLVFSGLLTAIPLMLFSYATQRVSLSTIGLLQYINPTGQFIVAVMVFGEPFGFWHGLAFGLIWTGLTIYSLSSLSQERASRR